MTREHRTAVRVDAVCFSIGIRDPHLAIGVDSHAACFLAARHFKMSNESSICPEVTDARAGQGHPHIAPSIDGNSAAARVRTLQVRTVLRTVGSEDMNFFIRAVTAVPDFLSHWVNADPVNASEYTNVGYVRRRNLR